VKFFLACNFFGIKIFALKKLFWGKTKMHFWSEKIFPKNFWPKKVFWR